jgi:hypothetical protein
MISSRAEKVATAWADAYRKIGASVDVFCERHGPPPNCLDMIRNYAPDVAGRIEDAEKIAEVASVEWAKGGPGGVQAKIDTWINLWLEGLQMVGDAR